MHEGLGQSSAKRECKHGSELREEFSNLVASRAIDKQTRRLNTKTYNSDPDTYTEIYETAYRLEGAEDSIIPADHISFRRSFPENPIDAGPFPASVDTMTVSFSGHKLLQLRLLNTYDSHGHAASPTFRLTSLGINSEAVTSDDVVNRLLDGISQFEMVQQEQ